MILQAQEYEAAQGVELEQFFKGTEGKWRTDIGRAWAEEIVQRRAAVQAQRQGEGEGESGQPR